MKLREAETLANSLMTYHNLSEWSFSWNNRKRSIGLCSHKKKMVQLSTMLIPFLDINEVKNTILHEIAHVLVGIGHGHNHVWRRKALEIGCNGERTSSYNTNVQAKYLAKCTECEAIHKVHRLPKREHCCTCIGYFDNTRLLTYVQQY